MSNVADFEKHKAARGAAEFMASIRNDLVKAVLEHEEGPSGLAILAGLALFNEAARDYCDSEEELDAMLKTAKKLAEDFSEYVTENVH